MRQSLIPRSILTALLLAVAPLALPAQGLHPDPVGLRPDAPAYAKHGPYWVGAHDLVIPGPDSAVSLPATLWYPALNPAGLRGCCSYASDTTGLSADASGFRTTLEGAALRDAATDPAGQPYPLLVFSPENPRSRVMYARLLEHLASYGFLVLGIDHVQDTFTRRPRDLMKAIDFALGPKALPATVDPERIVLIGDGTGAKTALNVAGVSFSRSQLDPYDPRVKAVVSITLIGSTNFMDASRAELPMLFLIGSNTRFRPLPDMEEIYQTMPAHRKALVVLVEGGSEMCTDPSLKALRPTFEWGSLDLDRGQDLANHFVTAFLLDLFKGDKDAHQALRPESVKFEDVHYTSTWE